MSTAESSPVVPTAAPPTAGVVRAFAALVGVTSLGVLVMAVLAGAFVDQGGREGWVNVHGMVANVVVLAALVTAVVAVLRLRRAQPGLTVGAIALLVLVVVQTALGHAITDGGADRLIIVHVPLAMVIFGLAVYLSFGAAQLRRSIDAVR